MINVTRTMPPATRPRPVAISMNETRPQTRTAARQPASAPVLTLAVARLRDGYRNFTINKKITKVAGSRGDISVLFLEQAEPRIDVAVGDLEQPGNAAAAAVNDPVALRQ